MAVTIVEEPKGIPFFNVKSGETHYLKLEPAIAAYINSSDMGINASRDQDFGWKLGAEWVKKVKAFRRNNSEMAILTAKNGGNKPTTVQILYAMYGEQLRAYEEEVEEHENPFEEQYLQDIASGSTDAEVPPSLDTDDDDDVVEKPAKPKQKSH